MESKRGPKESCALDKSQLCRKSIVLLNQRARLNMRHRRNVVKEKKFENKYRQLLTTFQQFQKSRKRCSQELVRCHDAIDDKQKTIEFLCKRLCEYSAAYDNERIRLDNKYVKVSTENDCYLYFQIGRTFRPKIDTLQKVDIFYSFSTDTTLTILWMTSY